MKTLAFTLVLLSSLGAFAKCDTQVEVKLFSNPFFEVQKSTEYKKLLKQFKTVGLKVTENKESQYHTVIEAGVERGEEKDVLLSHFQIINRKGKVVYEDYRSRNIAKDKLLSGDKILSYAKRHLSAELPLCEQ